MDASKTIDPRELSVVVQGPVIPEITRRSLQSIRTHLPGAQIILSTWEGADVRDLEHDVLVLNRDPGPIETKAYKGSNLNRLLWSTKEGLKKADRPYGLKFRTDLQLTGSQLLDYFDRFPDYLPEYKIFERRVVISSVVTWSTARHPPGQFHPSDMFGLGRTEDLKRWWSAPLYPFEGRAGWETGPAILTEAAGSIPEDELSPEQYIWLNALNRTRRMSCRQSPSPRELGEDLRFLLNNFIVVDAEKAGVKWLKPGELSFGHQAAFLGFSEYRFLYEKQIEGHRFAMPPFSIFWKLLQLRILKSRLTALKVIWRIYKRARGLDRPDPALPK